MRILPIILTSEPKLIKMKIKLITPIAGLMALTGCYEQQRDCKAFHEGKFKFEQEIDGKLMTTTFERRGNLEIETFEGRTDSASVRWVSDCEYVLTKLRPKNMQEKKAISIKILSTTDKTYNFEYGLVGSPERRKGTVTKLD